jgi:tetratricopeptide (TPR) repeat protein
LRPLVHLVPALASLLVLTPCSEARAQNRPPERVQDRSQERSNDRPVDREGTPEELARRHHDRGTRLYNLGQFEEAISEYRRGYEQRADPVFLYNIAQAYRQLGAPDKALFFYRRYLSTAPEATNRAQVEELVADLERLVAAEQRARTPAPPQPLSGATARPPGVPATSAASFLDPGAGAAADRPVWHRWGFWAGLGTLVAGGLVLGLLVASSRGGEAPPPDLGSMRFF